MTYEEWDKKIESVPRMFEHVNSRIFADWTNERRTAEAELDKLRGLLQRMSGHFVEIHELDWRRAAINGCAFTAREIAHMALLDIAAALEEKEERMETFLDGEELREALATELHEGDRVCFHGVEHRVIDAGEQGLRVAAQKEK